MPIPRDVVRRSVLVLSLAVLPLIGGCASSGAVPRPFPTPASRGSESSPRSQAPQDARGSGEGLDTYSLVGTALSFRGVPYRNGGTDPSGFDCSGFTQYVFSRYGIALPRDVSQQFQQGQSVKIENVVPGDLLFFETTASGATHVAIAIGGDQFVHAPSSTGVVRVERLSAGYWSARFLAARRLAPAN